MRLVMTIAAALGVGSAALANTNALKNPVNTLPEAGSFEVVNKWTPKVDYFWCSAAREALKRGASHRDRLYISSAMGPSRTEAGERAVAFTYRPDSALVARGLSSSDVTQIGSNMSVSQGKRRCVREIDG